LKIKQYTIILLFFGIGFSICLLSFLGIFENYGAIIQGKKGPVAFEEINESFFKDVEYFLVEKNKPFIHFTSMDLTMAQKSQKVLAFRPKGRVYSEFNPEGIGFEAFNGVVSLEKKELQLDKDVLVYDDVITIAAQKMLINASNSSLQAYQNISAKYKSKIEQDEISIKSNQMLYRLNDKFFEFQGSVEGQVKRKKIYEESLSFKTDFLTLEGQDSLVNLKGGVFLSLQNYEVQSNEGQIFLESYNKKLKYYALSDDVRLQERVNSGQRVFTRKAFAEKLEGFMTEKRVVLTGLPKVFQDQDVIRGNRITIRENNETVEVDDANTNIFLKE